MLNPTTARIRDNWRDLLKGGLGLAGFIVIVAALLGGGSRPDVLSLVALRPVSIVLLALAIIRYRRQAWADGRVLILLALIVVVLAAVQVVPLPPGIWTQLPGREIVAETYRALGASLPWAPLSVSPSLAWNALFSLALPFALLLAAIPLSFADHRRLAVLVLAVCLMGGFISLLQVIGGPTSQLYFYRITNAGAAVGLFANRNHNALFLACSLPILGLFWHSAQNPKRKSVVRALVVASALLLFPIITLTGSRGGLLVAIVGMAGGLLIALRGRSAAPSPAPQRRGVAGVSQFQLGVGWAIVATLLVTVTLLAARSSAFGRLVAADPAQEGRLQALPTIWAQVEAFWPTGSGGGSFEYVYRRAEEKALIGPQYLNHAHNDWLEIALTHGLIGVVMLVVAIGAYLLRVWTMAKGLGERLDRSHSLAWAGATIVAMIAILSVFDYPLRVPSIAVIFVIALVWMARGSRQV